jgi:hypothetical protein
MTETKNDGPAQANGELPVFPFFVGCGRSGTTLVREIFSAHPQLAIPPESHFLARMVQRQGRGNRPVGFSVEQFLADLYAGPWVSRWGLLDEDIKKTVLSPPPADLADAVRRVFALYANVSGKPRYGDKTPRYVLQLMQLAKLFPEARFVHIIRDGRDVALSQLEKAWGANNAVEGALIWRQRVEAGREAGRYLGPARYREIRYETLVDDPEDVVRSLCDFIEVLYDPAMLRYYERPRVSTPAEKLRVGKGDGSLRLPPTKGLREWRRQMPKRDVAAFELIAGDLLRELGYERGVHRWPAWTRFSVGFRVLRYRSLFAGRRLIRRAKLKMGLRIKAEATEW